MYMYYSILTVTSIAIALPWLLAQADLERDRERRKEGEDGIFLLVHVPLTAAFANV